jgi:CRISPR-associated exonuclease Cas4
MMCEGKSIPISIVEKYRFCPRQAYLTHAEQIRSENRFTVEGTAIHERVIEGADERRGNQLVTRSLSIASQRLGVHGFADVVEFRKGSVVPIEYKRGGVKGRKCEWLQLCLQALCLEEMLSVSIPEGFVYHHATHRKESIQLTVDLRQETETAVQAVHQLIEQMEAPAPVVARHCKSCSLYEFCMPAVSQSKHSAHGWVEKMLKE